MKLQEKEKKLQKKFKNICKLIIKGLNKRIYVIEGSEVYFVLAGLDKICTKLI